MKTVEDEPMAAPTATSTSAQHRVTVAFNALRLLDRPISTSSEVADAIEQDPQLSRQVLRMARSPLCGVRADDLSVARSLVLLGFLTVRKLVVLSLCRDLGSLDEGAESDQWRRALWVGIAAEELTRRIDETAASEALMTGMTANMADAFADHSDLGSSGFVSSVDPARMARFLRGAEALAELIMNAQPALPPTATVDEALEQAGLQPMYDGRLAVDIRRGYELYASLIS